MQATSLQTSSIRSLRPGPLDQQQQVDKAREVEQAYRKFVGSTFFGQMLKAMRTSVGKPAYFHGGHAEEVFQSQLDQTLADHMTEASADRFADPMFAHQFPQLAELLERADSPSLNDLSALRRR
jgi:Rod binding domain-containing protein